MTGQSLIYNRFPAGAMLTAAYNPAHALRSLVPICLPPGVSIAKGNLIVPPANAGAADVQTIAFSGTPTGGTFTLSGVNPITGQSFTTAAITYAASGTGDTNIQAAINAILAPSGATVAVSSLVVTFGGLAATMPVPLMTLGTNGLTGGTSPTLTIAHTTVGATSGTYSLYTGSGSPTAWTQYDYSTDSLGNVTYGLGNAGDQQGTRFPYAMAYTQGDFYAAELPNLDSAAVTALKARFKTGALGVAGAVLRVA